MSETPESAKDIFAKWVEAYDAREPIVDLYFATPTYAQKTIRRRIEPYASRYDRWKQVHPSYWTEDGPPDDEWYAPTPKLLKLEALLDNLEAKGFETIPNPDYDETHANEYYEKHRSRYRPVNQTKILVGQSYNPDIVPGMYLAPESAYTTAFDTAPVFTGDSVKNETPDQG